MSHNYVTSVMFILSPPFLFSILRLQIEAETLQCSGDAADWTVVFVFIIK